jgi:transposase
MDAIYVGLDVSKDRLDADAHPIGAAFSTARKGAALEELVERLEALAPALIAVEATGGFETVVAAALAGAGLPVVVVNPAQLRHYAQALGKRAKTDPIDAQVIARFAEAAKPEPRPLPDATTQLADLVGRRRQIVEMMAAEGQRERRASKRLHKSIARLRKALETELAELDAEINEHVRGSPVWAAKEDLLASRRRPDHRPHSDRRNAGARNPRPPSDRSARRPCALDQAVRPVEGQELHRRGTQNRAQRPLHGRLDRGASQPRPRGFWRPQDRRRKTENDRPHRRRPKAPHHPQRNPQRQTPWRPETA